MVKFEWAYDKDIILRNVTDFSKENKTEFEPFYCRICYDEKHEQKKVIAKKGEIKRHHFALKNHSHSPEIIAHSNAIDDIYRLLKVQLDRKEPFYIGMYLNDDFTSKSIIEEGNIQRLDILKNIDDIKIETDMDNERRPFISLSNQDGEVIRAIDIVVLKASDNINIKDFSEDGIELIILKIEPPDWIQSKLDKENEIKFNVKRNEIYNPSIQICIEEHGDGEFCIDDENKRLLCFVRNDNSFKILDFEKCPIYFKQDHPRCLNILPSGKKCNRVLLKSEKEFCDDCSNTIKENSNNKILLELLKKPLAKEPEFIAANKIQKVVHTEKSIKSIKIQDLNLSAPIKQFYIDSGITSLYPPQSAAIDAGLLERKNIVAAIPTASGKTLLAEFAMLKSVLNENKKGKALYIVPLRALASEKYDRFRSFETIKKNDGRGVSAGIATGDLDSPDNWLGQFDIIVATSEKVDSLLRNGSRWIDEVTVIIADEVHLIDSADRGPTLEIVLAKLMKQKPQIIALSATIGNAKDVAKWLSAELVVSDWRPIVLKEGVFFGNAITFGDRSQREVKGFHKDNTISLAADTLNEGGQCIIFESSRKNSEGQAGRTGVAISKLIDMDTREKLKALASQVMETSEVETTKKLAHCIENGSAFHHAGLISEQRKIIENGFRDGTIKVIAATPTLAAGLNLPARRVIIKGYRRYDVNFGQVPIPVLEYKQMAGRAGRPRLDPYGESVLVAKNYDELEELMNQYVLAGPEKIWSKLGTENALRTHILSIIVTGFARTMDELLGFMKNTFYSAQQEPWSLKVVIDKIIGFLVEKKMIVQKDGLFPTRLGELVSRLYIDPLSASTIIEGLEKIEEKDIQYTELTLLHLVSMTSNMRPLYLRSNDYIWLSDLVMEHHTEFVTIPSQSSSVNYEWFLSQVKTACVMLDWINEKKEEDIVNKFGIGEGDIRALSETTLWLVHSMAELAAFKKLSSTNKAHELEKRVEYGAAPELLDLIQIRGIGRVRSRKLYNAQIRDMEALRAADPGKVAKIIGTKVAIKVLKQIGSTPPPEEKLDEQRRLGDFG
jgi:helicase